MEENQSNWQNPSPEDSNNSQDTLTKGSCGEINDKREKGILRSQEESFYDEKGRIRNPNDAQEIAIIEDLAWRKELELKEGIDLSERRRKNLEIMELLERDPLYKDAFDRMILPNGENILLFQPGVYSPKPNKVDSFYEWKVGELPYERYGNIFYRDTVCYFFSRDGLVVRNIGLNQRGMVPKLQVPNITKWYESISSVIKKVAEEEEDEQPVPDVIPSIRGDLRDSRITTFYFPNGLWTQGIKENLNILGRSLKEVAEVRRKNPDKPEDLLNRMKSTNT